MKKNDFAHEWLLYCPEFPWSDWTFNAEHWSGGHIGWCWCVFAGNSKYNYFWEGLMQCCVLILCCMQLFLPYTGRHLLSGWFKNRKTWTIYVFASNLQLLLEDLSKTDAAGVSSLCNDATSQLHEVQLHMTVYNKPAHHQPQSYGWWT